MLKVAGIESTTEVEGPGCRFALWLQGCSLGCAGCCNPHMHDPDGGELIDEQELAMKITASSTDGLTIVGGEPLEQIPALNRLMDCLNKAGYEKGCILFTGFTWDELNLDSEKLQLAKRFDLVVAGRFDRSLSPDKRNWIGSSNQTVHFFSDRFADLRKHWPEHKSEIEIHISDEEVSINGFPLGDESEFEKFFSQRKGRGA